MHTAGPTRCGMSYKHYQPQAILTLSPVICICVSIIRLMVLLNLHTVIIPTTFFFHQNPYHAEHRCSVFKMDQYSVAITSYRTFWIPIILHTLIIPNIFFSNQNPYYAEHRCSVCQNGSVQRCHHILWAHHDRETGLQDSIQSHPLLLCYRRPGEDEEDIHKTITGGSESGWWG